MKDIYAGLVIAIVFKTWERLARLVKKIRMPRIGYSIKFHFEIRKRYCGEFNPSIFLHYWMRNGSKTQSSALWSLSMKRPKRYS